MPRIAGACPPRFFDLRRSAGACPPRFLDLPRSAGACPPRSLGERQPREGQALALRCGRRCPFIVARGPVPRDRSVKGSLARDRPSRYGATGGRRYRSAGACPPRFLDPPRSAGACPPRSLGEGSLARDRPSRYGAAGGRRLTRA